MYKIQIPALFRVGIFVCRLTNTGTSFTQLVHRFSLNYT